MVENGFAPHPRGGGVGGGKGRTILAWSLHILLIEIVKIARYKSQMYGFSAKVFLFLQLTDLFNNGVWKDIQDEEVQDELKKKKRLLYYYTRLPQLVLNSKADNTRKNYIYTISNMSCQIFTEVLVCFQYLRNFGWIYLLESFWYQNIRFMGIICLIRESKEFFLKNWWK